MELTGPRTVTILVQINFTTIFRVIVGGQIANFGKKTVQVHLMDIKGWPKTDPLNFQKSW